MLFDPSKEKFDLPSGLVQVADGECRQGCIVGEEQQSPQAPWISVANAAQGFRIGLRGIETLKHEHLIENESGGSVDRMRVAALRIRILFGSRDKEGARLMQTVEAAIIKVASIHDVEGARFGNYLVENVDVVDLAIGHMNEAGEISPHIQQGV